MVVKSFTHKRDLSTMPNNQVQVAQKFQYVSYWHPECSPSTDTAYMLSALKVMIKQLMDSADVCDSDARKSCIFAVISEDIKLIPMVVSYGTQLFGMIGKVFNFKSTPSHGVTVMVPGSTPISARMQVQNRPVQAPNIETSEEYTKLTMKLFQYKRVEQMTLVAIKQQLREDYFKDYPDTVKLMAILHKPCAAWPFQSFSTESKLCVTTDNVQSLKRDVKLLDEFKKRVKRQRTFYQNKMLARIYNLQARLNILLGKHSSTLSCLKKAEKYVSGQILMEQEIVDLAFTNAVYYSVLVIQHPDNFEGFKKKSIQFIQNGIDKHSQLKHRTWQYEQTKCILLWWSIMIKIHEPFELSLMEICRLFREADKSSVLSVMLFRPLANIAVVNQICEEFQNYCTLVDSATDSFTIYFPDAERCAALVDYILKYTVFLQNTNHPKPPAIVVSPQIYLDIFTWNTQQVDMYGPNDTCRDQRLQFICSTLQRELSGKDKGKGLMTFYKDTNSSKIRVYITHNANTERLKREMENALRDYPQDLQYITVERQEPIQLYHRLTLSSVIGRANNDNIFDQILSGQTTIAALMQQTGNAVVNVGGLAYVEMIGFDTLEAQVAGHLLQLPSEYVTHMGDGILMPNPPGVIADHHNLFLAGAGGTTDIWNISQNIVVQGIYGPCEVRPRPGEQRTVWMDIAKCLYKNDRLNVTIDPELKRRPSVTYKDFEDLVGSHQTLQVRLAGNQELGIVRPEHMNVYQKHQSDDRLIGDGVFIITTTNGQPFSRPGDSGMSVLSRDGRLVYGTIIGGGWMNLENGRRTHRTYACRADLISLAMECTFGTQNALPNQPGNHQGGMEIAQVDEFQGH